MSQPPHQPAPPLPPPSAPPAKQVVINVGLDGQMQIGANGVANPGELLQIIHAAQGAVIGQMVQQAGPQQRSVIAVPAGVQVARAVGR